MAPKTRLTTRGRRLRSLAIAASAVAIVAMVTCGSQGQAQERPYALRIESIGVDAAVVAIESTSDGVLEPPENSELAGWWSQGAALGMSRGSAVIVGHSAVDTAAVFDAMGELDSGDLIEVDGATEMFTYEVTSIQVVSKEEFAAGASRIFDQQGDGRLVLISCRDWDGSAWRSNIVATAELVPA